MRQSYHTLIIGTGCAGYNAAERLYDFGVRDIAVVTEGRLMGTSRNTGSDKQTYYKLSLCGADGDSVREMADTLYSGGGVMGEHALCEAAYSVRAFMHLVELGVPFPTNEYGEYAGYKTDHDPRTRATSCGPLTSKYMTEALERSVLSKGIEIIDNERVIKILTEDGAVTGIATASTVTGDISVIAAKNVVLCTGGPAGIYLNTVYPESQHGATGLAIDAGAALSNMEEWQYGIASTKFRWNLSGTYQQVLPRYISVDKDGNESEFLYEKLGDESLGLIFLKGYQWPFDTRKTEGSSKVDLLVADEIKSGKRVYLDFMQNPKGLENGFSVLPEEAYTYLERSGALFGTPIERLAKMNIGAIELYADHDIDLYKEYLEIAVCAQHCNGGVAVDGDWQTEIRGLYVAGEAAGTFGVYRPGGSALNSTQVGSLRAAEHIAKKEDECRPAPRFTLPRISIGTSNLDEIRKELQTEMSRVADFDRRTEGMKALFEKVDRLCETFFETAVIANERQIAELYRLYDMVLTQRATLSAMIVSAKELGTHGSAFVDRQPDRNTVKRDTRTLTRGATSYLEKASPMPSPELWFETLLARKKQEIDREKRNV
ncbi:MAG: FAD-binding protein [Clostridia bacterium]|nr:FAD-binding protein [Clostridia bacterium]MBR2908610.1 FAD-binding protein [Clostridia bacterium]